MIGLQADRQGYGRNDTQLKCGAQAKAKKGRVVHPLVHATERLISRLDRGLALSLRTGLALSGSLAHGLRHTLTMEVSLFRTLFLPAFAVLLAHGVWLPATAQAPASQGSAENADKATTIKDEAVTSTGVMTIDGTEIPYEATVGLMVMKDDEEAPMATFGYTYYRATNIDEPARRPIMFAYNGGPGSASLWLHMGVLGPRRVVLDDGNHTGPGPYAHVNNDYSILDEADLVMLDPPGTGYTRLIDKEKGKEYWGVDGDAGVVAEFIARFTTVQGRWLSPKFLLGESYGGMRSGAVAYQLMASHNMDLNGVILVSPFMDYGAGVDGVGTDLPHALYLSTFAATAWYHDLIKDKPADLRAFLAEVDDFAGTAYLAALHKGNRLAPAEREAMAQTLADYTGIEPDYWMRANLRVTHQQFLQEVQRRTGMTTGRIDSRYAGASVRPLSESMDYDAYFSKVRAAYTAAFQDYMANALGFGQDRQYKISAGLWSEWDYGHRQPGSRGKTAYANTGVDLEHAIKQNPTMKVLVQQGYYDLATPYGATDYFIDHLNLSPDQRSRVTTKYYEAGHMMYVHPESLEAYAADLRGFVADSLGESMSAAPTAGTGPAPGK